MASNPSTISNTTHAGEDLPSRYRRIRAATESLCQPLSAEDMCIQTMDDVSPTKWHLAHTSWFFETVLLKPHLPGYREFHPQYAYLFNSYYETFGERHARPRRGILSRPTVEKIYAYRAHVDEHMVQLLTRADDEIARLTAIGLNHEQQHQELMLTDIKHVFASNPLLPAYMEQTPEPGESLLMGWLEEPEGIREIGYSGSDGFAYDNETPRHRVWLDAYAIADRPVTNAEYLAFMADDGYRTATLWLSDAWDVINQQQWQAPLYWENRDGEWWHYTLQGARKVQPHEPVTHLSYYEADAYARWAGARLPSEAEWEVAASKHAIVGDFVETGGHHPQALKNDLGSGSAFFFGGVWEWTASPYGPYPGYRAPDGALGEYNAKFMCNQLVLRGGSCATPQDHIRTTYRNFFYPHQRWQFTGLRLARDLSC